MTDPPPRLPLALPGRHRLVRWETPRLCRGGIPSVRGGPSQRLSIVSRPANEGRNWMDEKNFVRLHFWAPTADGPVSRAGSSLFSVRPAGKRCLLPGKINNLRLLRLPFAAADVFLRIDGWRLRRQPMQIFAEMMQCSRTEPSTLSSSILGSPASRRLGHNVGNGGGDDMCPAGRKWIRWRTTMNAPRCARRTAG